MACLYLAHALAFALLLLLTCPHLPPCCGCKACSCSAWPPAAILVVCNAAIEAVALLPSSVACLQGMSDLAAPLVFIMRDEAEAFWCFAALMERLQSNFHTDSV